MIPFAEIDKGSELTVLENVTGKQVPQGVPLTLGIGEIVTVTQALGDTLTLDIGSRLVRIETEDLAKLGVVAPRQPDTQEALSLEDQVWHVLRQSYDPEIPVNIFDLGLVYTIKINEDSDVKVIMTLTAPGCPVAGGLLKGQRRWPVRAPHCPVAHFGHIFANWVATGLNYATWH